MKRNLLFAFSIVLIFYSCSLFESDSFIGEWEMVLDGDYSGSLVFTINDENTLKGNAVVNVNGYDYEIMYKGKVTEEGDLEAVIEARGQEVGEMTGKIDYEKGSGRWSAAGLKGTWKATKSMKDNE